METRNPRFTRNGDIDVEINHPEYGWIPFTASMNDIEPLGAEIFTAVSEVAAPFVKDLEEEKRIALVAIKKKRKDVILQPLNGFDVKTTEDRENIEGAITYFDSLATNGVINWTMANGATSPVSLSELTSARDGYVIRKAQAFSIYQTKKATITAATTVAELEAIDLNQGWPV